MKKMMISSMALFLLCSVAQGALWNGAWAGATYTSVGDASNDSGGTPNTEITQLESIYGTDGAGTGYYFRMTVSGTAPYNNAYMLNFNTDNNLGTGANAGTSTYIATGISGIDRIVDAHYAGGFFVSSHDHVYNAGLGDNILFNVASLASQGGARSDVAQLEWFVPTALLTAGTTVRASTLYLGTTFGGLDPTVTFDITGAINVVPEPTSMALLALGVAALGLRRKVRV